jgi:hypothetical protein
VPATTRVDVSSFVRQPRPGIRDHAEEVVVAVHHRRAGDIAVVEASGRYEVAELRAAIDAAVAPFGAAGAAGLLFDLRQSDALGDRPTDEVRAMAIFIASKGARFAARLAMVTGSDVAYGLMRLGAVVAESQGVTARVFRDAPAALAWLTAGTR